MNSQDMTAFTKKGITPTVTLIDSDVTTSLTNWTIGLAKEYSSIPVQTASLLSVLYTVIPELFNSSFPYSPGAGSDHMSFYRAGYPSAFATEGNPDMYVSSILAFFPL